MDENTQLILEDFQERSAKSIEHLVSVLSTIRTGRASPALVDRVKVEAYGSMTPLNQVAHISVPEPRQLMIKPFDVSIMKDIERALHASDLGLAPSSDGKVIRLMMPPLSEEQRKKLAAKVKEISEETRVALRNGRRDANKHGDQAFSKKEITEDFHQELKDAVQDHLKESEKRVDELVARKTDEIMND
ncbi:MAG: ribosome recycling factor [Planctomycetota bacterium]